MAQFFNSCGTTHIISNEASVLAAGFHKVKSYTQGRRHLTFYIHPNGAILSRMTSPRRHPIILFHRTKDQANQYFKRISQFDKWTLD